MKYKKSNIVLVLVVLMAIISLLALVSNNSFAFASRYAISSPVSFKTKSAPFSEVILNAHGGAAAIEAKGTPDFNTTATTNMGMYAATDDYGTSYYFRGAVNDNWVYFAGFYWRIIRINGDGSVRMIYSGSTAPTSSQATVMTGAGTQIETSKYFSSANDNKYVRYRYQESDSGAVDSIVKEIVDSWYSQNLMPYAKYLANGVFCNDTKAYTNASGTTSGGGSGTAQTYYAAYIRQITTKAPILTCTQTTDRFRVLGPHSNPYTYDLAYPIGLITGDEVAMAGGKNDSANTTPNTSYYLYNGLNYWTMTPIRFSSSTAIVNMVSSTGSLYQSSVSAAQHIRPVINIRGELVSSGNGTYNNPYRIVPGVAELAETVIDNHGGRAVIEAKTTPNFVNVSTTNEGMYAAADDWGTAYYFRGAVDDNWLYFAGYYWRIISVDGDDSVRIIYSGSVAPTASQSVVMASASTMVTGIAYNVNGNDNAYVGYMYTIGNAHGYGTSSNIKGATGGLEAWYTTNLSSYSDYISEYTLFCNDRVSYTNNTGTTAGGGTGTTTSYYAAYIRLGRSTKSPVLTCTTKNDRFTAKTSPKATKRLTYPIGLITADEVAMAGGKAATNNTSYYLYTGSGNEWFTMSPVTFSSSKAYVYRVNGYGGLVTGDVTVSGSYGMRPVISLNGDVIVKGNGTWNNPYMIY